MNVQCYLSNAFMNLCDTISFQDFDNLSGSDDFLECKFRMCMKPSTIWDDFLAILKDFANDIEWVIACGLFWVDIYNSEGRHVDE